MAEKVPRVVASIDVRKFKLDPMDGFLLTRIDGKLGPKDLARETGLPDFSVDRALEKLQKLGVIELVDPNAPPPRAAKEPLYTVTLHEPKYDPAELEEECDLAPDLRKRVLDLFYRLDDLDHWTLLGVTREADKKAVKRAYFELAAVMHPDRYFKKNLGKFKAKMEALFARITEAHDTLVDPEKRTEYETYLAEVATTRGMEAMLERALAEQQAAAAVVAAAEPQVASMAPPAAGSSPSNQPSRPSISPEELQARREALAKRLIGGNNSVRPATTTAPPVEKPDPRRYSNANDAMDALKRRYEERIENATVAQARKYIQSAEESLSKGDMVTAASNYALAAKYNPNDQDLAMRAQEVRNEADLKMCESYLKQAQYEERSGHWVEAARSWAKVARIKPGEPKFHDRTAHAMLKAEGDLRQAAEHAKQAVALSPSVAAYHVTLAEIYAKAGLTATARRAAEVGLQVEPENATLQGLLKKLK